MVTHQPSVQASVQQAPQAQAHERNSLAQEDAIQAQALRDTQVQLQQAENMCLQLQQTVAQQKFQIQKIEIENGSLQHERHQAVRKEKLLEARLQETEAELTRTQGMAVPVGYSPVRAPFPGVSLRPVRCARSCA